MKGFEGEVFNAPDVFRIKNGARAFARPLLTPPWLPLDDVIGFIPALAKGWLALRVGDDAATLPQSRLVTGLTCKRPSVDELCFVREPVRRLPGGEFQYQADVWPRGQAMSWSGAERMPTSLIRFWLHITEIRPSLIWQVTAADLDMMGFKSRIEFEHYVTRYPKFIRHGQKHGPAIWIVSFEQLSEPQEECDVAVVRDVASGDEH